MQNKDQVKLLEDFKKILKRKDENYKKKVIILILFLKELLIISIYSLILFIYLPLFLIPKLLQFAILKDQFVVS
jgi:hypothetical protein